MRQGSEYMRMNQGGRAGRLNTPRDQQKAARAQTLTVAREAARQI